MYEKKFIIQYIVSREPLFHRNSVLDEEEMSMTIVAPIEALDISVIRNILRSMVNEHWSVAEALDEYDVPQYLRSEYESLIEKCFID